jgi:hypothetical protein
MIKLLAIAGLVAAPAAVALGVWAGQNQTPPESVLAMRQNAPLVARPGREAAAAAKALARLEPPPPPAPKPADPPPPDVAVTFRRDVRALAPEEGRVMLAGARSLKLGDKYQDGWKLAEVTSRTATLKKGKAQRTVDFFQPDPAAVQALAAQQAQGSGAFAQVSFTNGLKPGQLAPSLTVQLLAMMRQSGLAQAQIDQMKRALESEPATQAQLMPIIMAMARNGRVPVADLTRFIENLARAGVIPERQVFGISQSVQQVAQSRQTQGIVQQLNRPQPGQFGQGGRGGPNGGFGGRSGFGRGGPRAGPGPGATAAPVAKR